MVEQVRAGQRSLEIRQPVIGIVPALIPADEAVHVAEQYEDAIAAAGGAPVVLPLTENTQVYKTLFPMCDGFVLSGGHDLAPEQYGGDASYQKLGEITPRRDDIERLILAYAYANDIPTLGICRGLQMINVFFGGTLYLDLNDQFAPHGTHLCVDHLQKGHFDSPIHTVRIVPGTRMGKALRREHLRVNSMHHQGIHQLAPILRPTAYAPDGLVEGVEVKNRTFIMGVQWHPEYFPAPDQMGGLFSALVNEAVRAHASGRRSGAPLTVDTMRNTSGCLNMQIAG